MANELKNQSLPDQKNPSSPKELWAHRLLKLPKIKNDAAYRSISPSDIEYLRKRFPFLQIVNNDDAIYDSSPPIIRKLSLGWTIVDCGCMLSTSPGDSLFTSTKAQESFSKNKQGERESEEPTEKTPSSNLPPHKGTRVKQSVDMAYALAVIAAQREWDSILILEGDELMKWAMWVAAQHFKIKVDGYLPTEADKKKYERLRKLYKEGITLENNQNTSMSKR